MTNSAGIAKLVLGYYY